MKQFLIVTLVLIAVTSVAATLTVPGPNGSRVITLPTPVPENAVRDRALAEAADVVIERRTYLSRATERHNGQ